MNYTIGLPGRMAVVRLAHGDPLYESIERVAAAEGILRGGVWVVGGIMNGGVVVGPQNDDERPPRIRVERFTDARELLGVGTLFPDEAGRPKLHLHAAIGKGSATLVGCPREGADCWLVEEVLILEILGVDAVRARDAVSGFALLRVGGGAADAGDTHAPVSALTDQGEGQ